MRWSTATTISCTPRLPAIGCACARRRCRRPCPAGRRAFRRRLTPAAEVLGLIENPLRRAGTDPVARHSGELFHLVRRGFERALLQVRITGMGETAPLTFGPVLVNRDEGHGVGFAGIVPPNALLVFDESGRVTLDGADVTSFAFAFRGATFADADAPDAEHDAVFDTDLFALATPGRRARSELYLSPFRREHSDAGGCDRRDPLRLLRQ